MLISSLALWTCHSRYESAVFEINSSSLEVQRRPAHFFLGEYQRTLIFRSRGQRVAQVDLFPDTGGYSRANLYKLTHDSLLLVDVEASYFVDTKAHRIVRDNVRRREGRFLGTFDVDATKEWRFIPSEERGELENHFRGQ
jgi:hypothetical protein